MRETTLAARKTKILASLLAALLCGAPAQARSGDGPPAAARPAPARRTARATAAAKAKKSPYRPAAMTHRAKLYYAGAWGVDRLRVSSTASGNLIRFTYRVTDPGLARALADGNATPLMVGQRSHAVLQIPVMEKVGPLRQRGSAVAGQEYWMTFSNQGHPVKPGDRVNVVIGPFHAEGLVVDGS